MSLPVVNLLTKCKLLFLWTCCICCSLYTGCGCQWSTIIPSYFRIIPCGNQSYDHSATGNRTKEPCFSFVTSQNLRKNLGSPEGMNPRSEVLWSNTLSESHGQIFGELENV